MRQIDNYWNRYDPEKKYSRLLYRDGYNAQASEQNEQQDIINAKIQKLARALFSDGDIIAGCQISVNPVTGATNATAGQVCLDGFVWDIPAADFTVPVVGTVAVGIRLKVDVISELEDPGLRNPAIGSRGEGLPGAWRERVTPLWAYDSDGQEGDFFPIYTLDDGVPRAKEVPPNLESFNLAIARYDRDSTGTGTYVCNGLGVALYDDLEDGRQVYGLAEGRARIAGAAMELQASRRLYYNAQPDLRTVSMEVTAATDEAASGQRIDVAHTPLREVTSLRITVEVEEDVIHGAYTGCIDDLKNTGVVEILEVTQGDTTFNATSDFVKNGDRIDWTPGGAEPATGSTYKVKYHCIKDVQPELQDLDGFTVTGAVQGTQIMYGYTQMLPRFDRLAIDASGVTTWFKGIPSETNPQKPAVPDNLLLLATVYQSWRPDTRTVTNDAVRVVAFEEIASINRRLDYALTEIARTRLENDIATRESGAKTGMFVDPLVDDSMRDQGIEQSAAVIDGIMTLPIINANAANASADVAKLTTRPHSVSVLMEQPLRTGEMQVNPYMNFDPIPAKVTLSPAVDQWTETKTNWTSAVTRQVSAAAITRNVGSGNTSSRTTSVETVSTVKTTETVSSSTTNLTYLRQIAVSFNVAGFGPGEQLASLTFDGIAVTPTGGMPTANSSGVISGKFTIPANVRAGSKSVVFTGRGGSRGDAIFTGQGRLTTSTLREVTTTTLRQVTTVTWRTVNTDPLAQTFTLEETKQLAGVDLWFTAKGGQVMVQLRSVSNGVPEKNVLAECKLEAANIVTTGNGHTRCLFGAPVTLEPGEYAVCILCNDSVAKLALAQMGKFDSIHQKWVTAQAYTVGVMLSSSNASTWTPHQDQDLAFRLLEATYDTTGGVTTEVDLGSVAVENATDFVLMGISEIPSAACRVEYLVTMPDGSTHTMAEGQGVGMTSPVTGEVGIKARLTGDGNFSPILYPGAQLIWGQVKTSADYYTRSIVATNATKASLVYDAIIPSGATVTPEIQIDEGSWQSMTAAGTTMMDDNFVEYRHTAALSGASRIKVRFTLTGTVTARPVVSNIRFLAVQ